MKVSVFTPYIIFVSSKTTAVQKMALKYSSILLSPLYEVKGKNYLPRK
ncbi:hypothetical protein B4119_4157 [Parageobacillus caldoxylosilyticus]|uniref:Uncharacterized protein n=1 Tax=Saccharococcus caldoxylosilyticus TaxID=81408 RepID=A0A150LJJ5_9BACL|nr:hypothetical protein B4119_4157 [Parageobacillus caldoxylosilyticus]